MFMLALAWKQFMQMININVLHSWMIVLWVEQLLSGVLIQMCNMCNMCSCAHRHRLDFNLKWNICTTWTEYEGNIGSKVLLICFNPPNPSDCFDMDASIDILKFWFYWLVTWINTQWMNEKMRECPPYSTLPSRASPPQTRQVIERMAGHILLSFLVFRS